MTSIVTRFRNSVAQRAAYNRIVGELTTLSQRELADIGIASGNIREIARVSVYGK